MPAEQAVVSRALFAVDAALLGFGEVSDNGIDPTRPGKA